MHNAAMTSIRYPHTKNIFDEFKKIEWRKRPLPRGKHYVYECVCGGGSGMVIGEITISAIRRYNRLIDITCADLDAGCVDLPFLRQYAGKKPLYAHVITSVIRYDKPIELSRFGLQKPPQSWCWVKEIAW